MNQTWICFVGKAQGRLTYYPANPDGLNLPFSNHKLSMRSQQKIIHSGDSIERKGVKVNFTTVDPANKNPDRGNPAGVFVCCCLESDTEKTLMGKKLPGKGLGGPQFSGRHGTFLQRLDFLKISMSSA